MKRRSNGEGTIYSDKNGRWYAEISYGKKPDGTVLRKKFSATTEREVRKKAKLFKNQISEFVLSQEKTTVAQYCDNWLFLRKKDLKPISYQRLESTINTYIKPKIGFCLFSQLTSADIQNLIDNVALTKSYSSVKKIYDCINAMYKYDISLPPSQNIVKYNPCNQVIIKKANYKGVTKDRIFSDNELSRIKEEVQRTYVSNNKLVYPYGLIYLLMLNTGLRMGEALALKKEDVDLKNKTLVINKNIVQIKNEAGGYTTIIQDTPKTTFSNRAINLNKSAFEIIKALFELFPETEYLIVNKNNKFVSPQNAEKTWTQILKKCNIERKGRGCHALRHTFSSKLYEKGMDSKFISSILGHSSTQITNDIYITISQEFQARKINMIPEI